MNIRKFKRRRGYDRRPTAGGRKTNISRMKPIKPNMLVTRCVQEQLAESAVLDLVHATIDVMDDRGLQCSQ